MTAAAARVRRKLTYERLPDLLKRRVADNPKGHDEAFIREMIDRYGYIWPVLVDDNTGKLGAGHGRLQDLDARKRAGGEPPEGVDVDKDGTWLVPVLRGVSFKDMRALRGFVVGDNRAVERGGWQDNLGKYLMQFGNDMMGVGYTAAQARSLLASETRVSDVIPDVPKKPLAKNGEVWILGDHVLVCGDSTDRAVVSKALRGKHFAISVTSPPYNQSIEKFSKSGMQAEGTWVDKVRNKAYSDSMPEDKYQEWQRTALTVWHEAAADGASLFYNHKNRFRDKQVVSPLTWIPGPFRFRQEIIWRRGSSVTLNARMFIPAEERIYWLYKGDQFAFNDTTEIKAWTNVWDISNEKNLSHAVGFPTELPRRCIKACSSEGDIVFEPYSGSGTTIVVAQELGRRACGVEKMPGYVDVAVERWQNMTGGKARRA